jgi:hypothetical protein
MKIPLDESVGSPQKERALGSSIKAATESLKPEA